MLYKALAALVLSLLFCAVGSAQVVYEPVVSQYRTDAGGTFYYGGSDPRAISHAARQVDGVGVGRSTREGRYGVGYLHRDLIGRPPEYVVADGVPVRNAVACGYTSVDARNDAYASVPRFFRASDLTTAAVPAADGVGVVVPAQAVGAIDIRPVRPSTKAAPATGPASQPKPILIIPKSLLRPDAAPSKSVAAAR